MTSEHVPDRVEAGDLASAPARDLARDLAPVDAPHISIAAPAFNEADGIADVVREWDAHLSQGAYAGRYEIVVCNDGSSDNTGAILDALTATVSALRPVHFTVNQGAAAALTKAIHNTRGTWVLLLDSDGQFPVENMEAAFREAERSQAVAVIGVRPKKADSAFARFGTWSSAVLCNLFCGSSLKDFNSAFKLVRGDLVRGLSLEAKGLNYSTEVTARILERGVRFAEVEISHRAREKGVSSMKRLRGAVHRFLFVAYIGLRQLLLRVGVLQRAPYLPPGS